MSPERRSPARPGRDDLLAEYRGMRKAQGTREPFGGATDRPGLFVVQKHDATRMHYDFRLELDGVLLSWAVPRGPSFDPKEKRLAVHVEDHPVEYADFEGIIPEGNYGAGAVIVWDQGEWIALEEPREGMKKGKLLFELKGHKLRGVWTLVRTKRQGGKQEEWLLIKKPDAYAGRSVDDGSIFSGLTVDQLEGGETLSAGLRDILVELEAPRRPVDPKSVKPMLAEVADNPFSGEGWLFEMKYDGFRLLVVRQGAAVQLFYRSGLDATAAFPEIARAAAALPFGSFIADGEVVVQDEQGRPSFQRLQKRFQLSKKSDIARATVSLPATLYLFDLLAFEDFDLRPLPLVERKRALRRLLPMAGPLRYADHIPTAGEAMFAEVQKLGLEGIVAKRADAAYRAGRSSAWLKIRTEKSGDFVIVGFSAPKGARAGFGALHVAAHAGAGGPLVYSGRVGTGFSDALLTELRRTLDGMVRKTPPCRGNLPSGAGHRWIEPRLVAEVRYKERTADGQLRQPSFVRLRDDKTPEECVLEGSDAAPVPPIEPQAPAPGRSSSERTIHYTNLDKIFWPEDRYSKGDLIAYYRDIAPWLLRYLEDRPVVLTRYPDGIAGKSFFQKDAPEWVPEWVRTERMWSEGAEREIDYFVAEDLETLLFIVNLGTIPLHVWSSRVATLSAPDWCILDLDPKGAPFADVLAVAKAIRALTEEIELPAYVKTSGSTGLHILVPLGGQLTYEQSRTLGELIGRIIVSELPDIATVVRMPDKRGGRVYIDYVQNGHGRLLVCPFSVRPLPGAPVSMPLRWREVNAKLDPRGFTIKDAARRMQKLGEDPLSGVLADKPNLGRALELLERRTV